MRPQSVMPRVWTSHGEPRDQVGRKRVSAATYRLFAPRCVARMQTTQRDAGSQEVLLRFAYRIRRSPRGGAAGALPKSWQSASPLKPIARGCGTMDYEIKRGSAPTRGLPGAGDNRSAIPLQWMVASPLSSRAPCSFGLTARCRCPGSPTFRCARRAPRGRCCPAS